MIDAFPSDRNDQPFSICVLPRGTRGCWSVANAHRSKSTDKDLTIGPVPVTNEIAGSLFPPTCFRARIFNPFCGWMRCDAKPQNMSPAVPQDQQSIEQTKRDCRHDEHIHRSDPISVIAEECPPALGRRVSSLDHVLGHAGLSDIDAELEEFSMIRGAPHRGLAMLISRISLRISNGTVGPPRAFDFQRQYNRKPARCHLTTVSGLTIASASRTPGRSRWRQTKINRSIKLKVCFLGAVRRRTFICCGNVQISASSAARDRNRSATIQTMSLTRSLIP